ncbi:uncharacterized protein AFUA_5G09770 [Aspergillus fumigatus Af293]|uniref:Uncharacterized protein n=1 Tax=Aspergillus fumigatus (strain ATCC MYA-4609 / CBS 101355 / FGSC A1100 / Af293) TaxID=330879 RepID=Q4WUV1_ASPFU|nr:hypothetical protein AFUA_5G09770 [Aspergillus fumigatus Af293]EAL91625.1 hypothetical protein AFUA_5G09770 [Aspergillus fumigatus Af293]
MRGKNTGKQRRSIKKQQTVAELKHLFDAPGRGSVMPRQVLWGDLCLTAFPHELNSESTAPMHRYILLSIIRIPLPLTLESQRSLTLVKRCFRRSSVLSSTLYSRLGSTTF